MATFSSRTSAVGCTLGLAMLLGHARVLAQDAPQAAPATEAPAPADLPKLRIFDTGERSTPTRPLSGLGDWRIFTDTGPNDPAGLRQPTSAIPKWRAGAQLTRNLSSRLQVSAGVAATRGSQGPTFLFRELGTGRDLSVNSALTGPGSYKMLFDTTFTIAVPLKTTGRVRMKAIGELWNPFTGADTTALVPLPSRAFRIGLSMTF